MTDENENQKKLQRLVLVARHFGGKLRDPEVSHLGQCNERTATAQELEEDSSTRRHHADYSCAMRNTLERPAGGLVVVPAAYSPPSACKATARRALPYFSSIRD